MYLGRCDPVRVVELAAEQVRVTAQGESSSAAGAGAVVDRGQRRELGGELLLGVRPQHLAGHAGFPASHARLASGQA